jgi:hypothetical protein
MRDTLALSDQKDKTYIVCLTSSRKEVGLSGLLLFPCREIEDCANVL